MERTASLHLAHLLHSQKDPFLKPPPTKLGGRYGSGALRLLYFCVFVFLFRLKRSKSFGFQNSRPKSFAQRPDCGSVEMLDAPCSDIILVKLAVLVDKFGVSAKRA